jgi:hypothetical protein
LVPFKKKITLLLDVYYYLLLTISSQSARIEELDCGPVAQLGARFHGMEEVVGSIPTRSTIKPSFSSTSNDIFR